MKHIISLKDQSKQDLLDILNLAAQIKEKREKGEPTNYLSGKTLGSRLGKIRYTNRKASYDKTKQVSKAFKTFRGKNT